jgi:hypothetical protein
VATEAQGMVKLRINGHGVILPQPDARVTVHATCDRLKIDRLKMEFGDVSLDAALDNGRIDLLNDNNTRHGLRGVLFGGSVALTGHMDLGNALAYEVPIRVTGVDLAKLTAYRADPGDPRSDIAGQLSGQCTLTGSIPPASPPLDAFLENLAGKGDFEITDARLYELKAITSMASTLMLGENAGRFSHSAGVFTVGQRQIKFSAIAASSSSLGIQGKGSVAFDGKIDFHLMTALLDDWRKKLKRTGIPLISDILGEVAGGVQKLINTASSNLLYQFHVTGNVGQPQVTTEPVPVLTEPAAKLFDEMLKGGARLPEVVK